MVVVEVRQGTLGVDCGWSWLRSGTEQCGSRIAVGRGGRGRRERGGGGGGGEGRGGGEAEGGGGGDN